MAEYETICVVQPDVQGERLSKITDKIQKIFTEYKADKVELKPWGLRRLAYPIRKFKNASYLYYTYEGTGALVNELERNLGYDEAVLRYLTIKRDKRAKKVDSAESAAFGVDHGFERGFDRGGRDFGDRN